MDIAKLDKNLQITTTVDRSDLVWLDAAEEPFVTYGAVGKNSFRRLPEEVAIGLGDNISWLSRCTAGVRLRFRTDSPFIALHAEWDCQCRMPHMAYSGISGFDLYVANEGRQFYVHSFIPPVDGDNGFDSIVNMGSGMRDYVLNFPLYNFVGRLYVGVQEGCRFERPGAYHTSSPVVFYGSSITQGGCASRPGNSYQNMLSRRLDMDYINLGFSGGAKAEPAIVDYMAGLDMSVFVSDYDHNAPDPEHLRQTHYPLYEAIRASHPDIPYVMVTKPDFDKYDPDEGFQNARRRAIVMQSYARAVEAGDRNVYFVDGAAMFAEDQADSCTVDSCHPNDLGFYRMYRALLPTLERILYLPR